jgi:ATP-dependent Zn protease
MRSKFKIITPGPLTLKRLRVAYHEIGHVIIFHHFGMPFNYVTIKSTRNLAGHVNSPEDEKHLSPEDVEKCTIVLLAGEMLERIIFGRHHFSACGAHGDFEIIYRINDLNPHPLRNADKEKHRKFFYRNGRKVLEILNTYMNEINVLAHELQKKKTLSQNEVRKIIENHKLPDKGLRVPEYKIEKQSRAYRKRHNLSLPLPKGDLPF